MAREQDIEVMEEQAVNNLAEVSFQLFKLYDRWSLEHQHVARREAEMSRTIERMEETIKGFASNTKGLVVANKEIKAQLAVNIEQISKLLAKNAENSNKALKDTTNAMAAEMKQVCEKITDVIVKATLDAATKIGRGAVESALASCKQELSIMQRTLVGSAQEAHGNIEKITAQYKEMEKKAILSTWSAALIVAIVVSCALGYVVNWQIERNLSATLARKFGQLFDTIDYYAKAIEKSAIALEKAKDAATNKNKGSKEK